MNNNLYNKSEGRDGPSVVSVNEQSVDDQTISTKVTRGSGTTSLRAEAAAGFRHLNGHWSEVIIRSMSSSNSCLPELVIG